MHLHLEIKKRQTMTKETIEGTFSDFDFATHTLAKLESNKDIRNALKMLVSEQGILPGATLEQKLDILLWRGNEKTRVMINFRNTLVTAVLGVLKKQQDRLLESKVPRLITEQLLQVVVSALANYFDEYTFFEKNGFSNIQKHFGKFFGRDETQILTQILEILEDHSNKYLEMRTQKVSKSSAKQEIENVLELVFNWKLFSPLLQKTKQ